MQGLADATVRAQSNGTVIARTQHVYELASGSPAGVSAIVERETREEKFELDGAPTSTTRTRRESTPSRTSRSRPSIGATPPVRTTRTVFENDTSRWLIGMVRRLKLTASAPGTEPQTRTRESQYDRSGRLARAILEPDHPELRLERVYTFDLFGNVSAIETSGFGIAPRSELTFFDPRGQAPILELNPLGQSRRSESIRASGPPCSCSTRTRESRRRVWTTTRSAGRSRPLGPTGSRLATSRALCDAACPAGAAMFARTNTPAAGP